MSVYKTNGADESLFMKEVDKNTVVRVIKHADGDIVTYSLIVYHLDKKTKEIYSIPNELRVPFEVSDYNDLGIELSEEQKEFLDLFGDDDTPF